MSELEELRKYHAEIVSSDGHECEAMRLTRWAIAEIDRLRGDLAAESNSRVILLGEIQSLRNAAGQNSEVMAAMQREIDRLAVALVMAEDAAGRG
jgi:hypothetical protein